MITKHEALAVVVNEQMRGGDGSVILEHLTDKAGLYDKGRLFSRIILKPGCSIGYHTHTAEMEIFYIIKGTAEYDDNGTPATLSPGDVAYTPDGCGHAIANRGETDLEFIALIIYH